MMLCSKKDGDIKVLASGSYHRCCRIGEYKAIYPDQVEFFANQHKWTLIGRGADGPIFLETKFGRLAGGDIVSRINFITKGTRI